MSVRPFLAAARTILIAIPLVFANTSVVYAYIDPGTGSMVVQLLAAGVVGALFYVRRWRQLLTSWFLRRKSGRDDGSSAEREAD